MKLIVEGYKYQSEKAACILSDFDHKNLDGGVSTDYVGYCYSKSLQDCIFFLPKVICDIKDRVLGVCPPEDCLDFNESPLSKEDKEFIQGLNIWIYKSLKVFSKEEESLEILRKKSFPVVDNIGHSINATLLDRILALLDFYRDNKDFIIFTIKNIHSQHHKINWPKTVSRSQAIIQDDVPVYLDPISKKKMINWEEELMVIFFSILSYIHKYGFDIRIDTQYDLIKGEAFKAYLDGLGTRRLKQIKYRYYSDKTRKLWSLCYSFFATTDSINSSDEDIDFLIASSFHVAFEAMVDDLIGQPELAKLRKLDDGKVIDHIYTDTSLLSKDLVYYIGDSKYYKTSHSVQEKSTSAYKQYTYARNIVHDSIKRSFKDTWPFRDPLTEGYCITPNFFISAEIAPDHRYESDGFDNSDVLGQPYSSRQFNNRLFDRDTLWINQYNLNFLYLLSTYASSDYGLKEKFKIKARRFFREKTIDLMNDEYEFWVLTPRNGKTLEETLTNTVKWDLRGVVYRLNKNALLLAMEKPDDPRHDEDVYLTKYERIEVFERIRPIIEANFNHKRCALSKEEGVVFEYIQPQRVFYSFKNEDS